MAVYLYCSEAVIWLALLYLVSCLFATELLSVWGALFPMSFARAKC